MILWYPCVCEAVQGLLFIPVICIWTEVKSWFKTWEKRWRCAEAKWCLVLGFAMCWSICQTWSRGESVVDLSFWCYFMGSAHVSNGLWQLEIYLLSKDLSPTPPLWKNESHPMFLFIVQMHARCFVSCLQKASVPDTKEFSVWMQMMKHQTDGWQLKDHSGEVLPFCSDARCLFLVFVWGNWQSDLLTCI